MKCAICEKTAFDEPMYCVTTDRLWRCREHSPPITIRSSGEMRVGITIQMGDGKLREEAGVHHSP